MGFKQPNLTNAYQEINRAAQEMNSPYNEGFTSWFVKQDLYQLHFHLQKILKNASDFGQLEKEWLEEHYKNEMWNTLKESE